MSFFLMFSAALLTAPDAFYSGISYQTVTLFPDQTCERRNYLSDSANKSLKNCVQVDYFHNIYI